jgi:hypothetical protein
MKNLTSSLIVGIVLILVGVGILLDKWDIVSFTWEEFYPLVLLALSLLSLLKVIQGRKDASFWFVSLGILGLFYFLRNFDIIISFWYIDSWPVLLLALGLSFIVMYFFKSYDWGNLIPGSILTFLGAAFLLREMDVRWLSFRFVIDFWPLILVLIGMGIIVSSLVGKKQE